MTDILYKTECYTIIGACMEVHKKLGSGFLEAVYSEALEIELEKNKIPFEREKTLPVYYGDVKLKKYYRADFVCYDSIILELKAAKVLTKADYQQTLNNIRVTKFKLGILINFGESSLKYKRIIYTH